MSPARLAHSTAPVVACVLALGTVGCYNWRADTPLHARPVPLNTTVLIASPESLAGRRDEVARCYDHLRMETVEGYRVPRQHSRNALVLGLAGSVVGLVGHFAGSDRVGWAGTGAGAAVYPVTWLEITLNPRVRAARQRAARAEATWVGVRHQMSLWEEAGRAWNVEAARQTGDAPSAGAAQPPSKAAWQAEDAALHLAVRNCNAIAKGAR